MSDQDRRLDIKQAMRVFNKVQNHGIKRENCYNWQQFEASADYDGYTLYLSNTKVKLTLYFHNKYRLEFNKRHDLDEFFQQLAFIDKKI